MLNTKLIVLRNFTIQSSAKNYKNLCQSKSKHPNFSFDSLSSYNQSFLSTEHNSTHMENYRDLIGCKTQVHSLVRTGCALWKPSSPCFTVLTSVAERSHQSDCLFCPYSYSDCSLRLCGRGLQCWLSLPRTLCSFQEEKLIVSLLWEHGLDSKLAWAQHAAGMMVMNLGCRRTVDFWSTSSSMTVVQNC